VGVIIPRAELDRDGDALLSVQRDGYAVEAALTVYRALGFEPDAHKIVGGNIAYVELRHPGRG
jgi:hypothetical protein